MELPPVFSTCNNAIFRLGFAIGAAASLDRKCLLIPSCKATVPPCFSLPTAGLYFATKLDSLYYAATSPTAIRHTDLTGQGSHAPL